MLREKVPSVYWVGGDRRQFGRFWIATFANEGADKLADYIGKLRDQYRMMKADGRYDADEIADVVWVGKRAVSVYNKHFGAL